MFPSFKRPHGYAQPAAVSSISNTKRAKRDDEEPAAAGGPSGVVEAAAAGTTNNNNNKQPETSFHCRRCDATVEMTGFNKDCQATCGACGRENGCFDCSTDYGDWCSDCETYFCHDCPQFPSVCDDCQQPKCETCANFKPGKNRTKRCYSCQPWWQKSESASDFCRDCGSQRSNANFCKGCAARICEDCTSSDDVDKCMSGDIIYYWNNTSKTVKRTCEP